MAGPLLRVLRPSSAESHGPEAARAMAWVRDHESAYGGIRMHSGSDDGYPEVTGYLIPTLLAYGEDRLAQRFRDWLLAIQRADGSYTDVTGAPFVFDTLQILKGLLAVSELEAAQRAADWLLGELVDGGRGGFGDRYAGDIPEAVQLYGLPALVEASERLGDDRYRAAAEAAADFYLAQEGTLRVDDLTHFLAYQIEGLIDLGRTDAVHETLAELRALQRDDGAVRGRGGVDWVCTPGLAQLALCWYKTGAREPADRAVEWLARNQRPSGGFLGSYGRGATYFPDVELSWATKFFLDALLWRPADAASTDPQPSARLTGEEWHDVLISDATLSEVVRRVRRNQLTEWARAMVNETRYGERVLEIGSGTGEISLQIAQAGRAVTLLDVSEESLEFAKRAAVELGLHVEGVVADATTRLPFEDAAFDCVWSSGLLEHFTDEERVSMIAEWGRVARRTLVSIVPNAAALAYRVGKDLQERAGTWPYGIERPLRSLRADYEAAGLVVDREFSVAARHALVFLPPVHPLRTALDAVSVDLLEDADQGYLLVTIGSRR